MVKEKKSLIYLTGFMGAGKSTIGPILANTLGFSFIDTDKEIVKITGKSITEIFSELGEFYFRDIEHKFLREISGLSHTVIALGGGALMFERNMNLIKSTGTLIYLRTDEESLLKRLSRNKERPLLRARDPIIQEAEQLKQTVRSLMAAREQFYSEAHIIISTSGKKVGITVDEIVRSLAPHLHQIHRH
jgi:shikimate kinase